MTTAKEYKAARARRMDKRRARAIAALRAHGGGNLNDPHDMISNIVDCITDLLHLARREGGGIDDVVWSARNHFDCERRPDDIEQGETLAEVFLG